MVYVKLVVVGDSNTGKTSFVRSLLKMKHSNYWFLSDELPEPTLGAKVDVFRHSYKCEFSNDDVHTVELFDIGGSSFYRDIRGVFYTGTDGIIFVYSAARPNAFTSLLNWITEVLHKQVQGGEQPVPARILSSELPLQRETQMPVLVVGTKLDLVNNWGRVRHFDGILERVLYCDPHAEEITLSNRIPIAHGSPAFVALNKFLDRVVLRKTEPIVRTFAGGQRNNPIHKWASRSSF